MIQNFWRKIISFFFLLQFLISDERFLTGPFASFSIFSFGKSVADTNRNLTQETAGKEFRQDEKIYECIDRIMIIEKIYEIDAYELWKWKVGLDNE